MTLGQANYSPRDPREGQIASLNTKLIEKWHARRACRVVATVAGACALADTARGVLVAENGHSPTVAVVGLLVTGVVAIGALGGFVRADEDMAGATTKIEYLQEQQAIEPWFPPIPDGAEPFDPNYNSW